MPQLTRIHPSLFLLASASMTTGVLWVWADDSGLGAYELEEHAATQHDLPRRLREVSGLATDAGGRLFAHDDERARVYEVDVGSGKVLKRIDVGDGGERGDFEGVALAGERMFLVESDGTLYEFAEGDDRENVPFRRIRTDLGRRCEVEGLAYDHLTDALLLVCKTTRGRDLRGHLVVFAVPLADLRVEPEPRFKVPYSSLADVGARGRLHPSGIEVHPETGTIFVVAAREEGIVEIGRDGSFLAARELPERLHRQPEGIAILDEALLLADEGGGSSGTLTRYPRGGDPGA